MNNTWNTTDTFPRSFLRVEVETPEGPKTAYRQGGDWWTDESVAYPLRGVTHWREIPRAPDWIPVTERLPNRDIRVLVAADDCHLIAHHCDGAWYWDLWNQESIPVVTHWQPLPPLP